MAFKIPEKSWWGSITGENGRAFNNAVQQEQANSINTLDSAGQDIANKMAAFTQDADKFASDTLGDRYQKELGQTSADMQAEKAKALSRASQSGADISSAANFAQGEGEKQRQDAIYTKGINLQNEALQRSTLESQQKIDTASKKFYMLQGMGKEDEQGALMNLVQQGLGALGSAIPFF